MNNTQEIWRPIPKHINYEVSNKGRVRTRKHVRVFDDGAKLEVEPSELHYNSTSGYYYVWLDTEPYKVHRLVAETFIPNPDRRPWVRHKDNNVLNNNVDNLEWSSPMTHLPECAQNGLKVKCMNDNKEFTSIRDAASWYGLDYDKLYYAVKHNKKLEGIHVVEC